MKNCEFSYNAIFSCFFCISFSNSKFSNTIILTQRVQTFVLKFECQVFFNGSWVMVVFIFVSENDQ